MFLLEAAICESS